MKTRLSDRPLDHIRNIAPIAHGHINMRGIYQFNLARSEDPGWNHENGVKSGRDTA